MLTPRPHGLALLLAVALVWPCLPVQAAGLGAGDMESVCLVKTFKTGVGGMRLPVWRPYLLLKDGTAYANPKLAPDVFDAQLSRQNEVDNWGTWTQQGSDRALSMPGHAPMSSAQCLPPAAAGMPIRGSYKHVGGGGNTVNGGHASFMRTDGYRFYADGRFGNASNSGLISPGASTIAADAVRMGHYRIHDYSIDLRYDDGSEAHLFFYADGDQLLHIGDEDYVPAQ
ncbi:hypothetical protein [Dyella choica]|uniref:Uncharacterized protein n=1 Tax=Dyella choica TaxID=1927959 RepID=A0A3S0Q2G5_9GAMM|nr:hypothetical protein [Dyella choica]RUL70876.1 hypothetical protein EKH80_19800 [Dyella choica]